MFVLNILLALAWLALTGEWTPLNFFIGLVLGYIMSSLAERALGRGLYFRKVGRIIGFIGYFLWQLVLANLRVAYDIITPRHYMSPAVVAVPLDVRSEAQITLLANLITLTPGTLSLDVSPDQRTLYVHAMHVTDAESFRREIKDGFERYIKEVWQ